ncbi:MAG TPA: YhjD/YihY/BrkB family envelope integrity protein [Candidatus Binatia bacterium]|nr:YhjD/YihY/BrkB family envelope integrity protein [Candidatus Binatia bacterium]
MRPYKPTTAMSPSTREKKGSIEQLKTRIFDLIWDPEISELTRFKRLIHSLLKIGFMVTRDFIENLVNLEAMALAFKTLLSLAPLLAVIFSILKGFGVHNRMEPALAEALAPLGEKGKEVTVHLIGFVDKMSAGALGSIGLVTLFITVLSLMGTIEQAFNRIWHVKAARKLTRKFSDYLSVILVGPVLVVAAVTITATLQSNTFVQKMISLEPFGIVILTLLKFVPYFTLWGAFTFLYVFIPNTRVKLTSAVIGGLVAAVLWQTVGWGFTVFVASSTRYYAIYSSFAILLLFLLWLHVGWVIVLLGAQVAYAHQHIRFYEKERELLINSPAGREKLALQMMFLIGRNFFHGLDPLSVTTLASQLYLPAGLVRDFMETFRQSRLVLPVADEETFVLARDPERISIKEILDSVRNSGLKKQTFRTDEEVFIDELLRKVDDSVAQTLEGKSLQSLIVEHSPPSP